MKRKRLIFVMGVLVSLYTSAQQSKIFTHQNKDYQDALNLYNNQQYQVAQMLFEEVNAATTNIDIEANSAYYAANSAIRLGQQGADRRMEDFVKKYPTSTKRNSAYLDVGNYYFETGKYPYALKWYKKVDQSAMSNNDYEQFNFNLGYAYYRLGNADEAERYLKRVSNGGTYGSQAKYYLGYIAYEQDDYNKASERFDKITDPKILEEKMAYYQADLNFKSGNFETAIETAEQHLPKADRKEVSELHKIIGESYFNLKKYQEAIPHLKQYRGKKGRFTNTDFYLLGYSYYQLGNHEEAIGQFNKIIDGDNGVAQNAYYHLAECYLRMDKKSEALNAFRNASQMRFDAEIERDAMFNYAKLSYEIGNAYEPVPNVMLSFLEKYPKDERKKEVQDLLVDSFIISKNYEGAMKLLERNSEYANAETYQKVAFYWGIEQFMAEAYESAITSFSKSLKKPNNRSLAARAEYWRAESAFRLNRYDGALAGFKKFHGSGAAKETDEFLEVDYQMGYCFFKLKDYPNAIKNFAKAVKVVQLEQAKVADAHMRLGDGHFVTSNYREAISSYGRAANLKSSERDYAAFQRAICEGFLGNNAKKIAGLDLFLKNYPNSFYRDDALFELGNIYAKADKGATAIQIYDRLISEYSQGKFAPRAMLRQGLVHYSANENEAALDRFKKVVSKYPGTPEANQAVNQAKLIYVDMGRVNEYAQWVRGLDFVEVSDSELELASYEAADRKYIEGNTEAAIRGYENYLKDFPNGREVLKANFNLGQLYFGKGKKDKALIHFINVANSEGSEYTEQALTRIGEIYVGREDYISAMSYLGRLETLAEISQNHTFAQSNLMKGYYRQKNYQKTLEYANKVLRIPNIDNRIKSDAQIMIARSAIKSGDEKLAEDAYARVKSIAKGETAAEAWYYEAYFKNKKGAYEASNSTVQELAKEYAAHKKWAGKGLVVMAKNFYALDDAFQATYILESVIENFSDFEAIASEAKRELANIKSREAQTNSSIEQN